jgi:hypothetical protein
MTGAKHFIGKICRRHPELGGKRYLSGSCTGCTADRARAWRARRSKTCIRQLMPNTKASRYYGEPCRRHRWLNGLRYKSGHNCVECERVRGAERRAAARNKSPSSTPKRTRARSAALKAGKRFYQGTPCLHGHGKGGTNLRFTASGSCVACHRSAFARMTPAAKTRRLKHERDYARRGARAGTSTDSDLTRRST